MITHSRKGFGTTIGIVLVVVGIALIMILGSQVSTRSSRYTFQRAMLAARATHVAEEAIEEICTSPRYRQEFVNRIAQNVGRLIPGIPPSPALIKNFLDHIDPSLPTPPSDENAMMSLPRNPPHELATGLWLVPGPKDITVSFGSGDEPTIVPEDVVRSYQNEPSIKISGVKVRPVMYAHGGSGTGGSGHGGIARAQVTVSFRGSGVTVTRQITEDHPFYLDCDDDTSVTPPVTKCTVEIDKSYTQREVADADSLF